MEARLDPEDHAQDSEEQGSVSERVPGESIAEGSPVSETHDRAIDPLDEKPRSCHEDNMEDRVDDPTDCSEGLKHVLH